MKLRNMTSIYLFRGEEMLMLLRHGSRVADGLWISSAGGHFEADELNDPRACVLREMREELGLTPDRIGPMALRYITLRRTREEIRQNYYYFAALPDAFREPLRSDEGELRWIPFCELCKLKMPYTAGFMLRHYLDVGRYDDRIYTGTADGAGLTFTVLPEYED